MPCFITSVCFEIKNVKEKDNQYCVEISDKNIRAEIHVKGAASTERGAVLVFPSITVHDVIPAHIPLGDNIHTAKEHIRKHAKLCIEAAEGKIRQEINRLL